MADRHPLRERAALIAEGRAKSRFADSEPQATDQERMAQARAELDAIRETEKADA